MSVRSVGVDAPMPSNPLPEAGDAAAPTAAQETQQGKAVAGTAATPDGVDAAKHAQESIFGEQRLPEGDLALPADAVGLGEVLAELAGALGADPNFQTLALPVQEKMQTALQDNPGLADVFKRLANSPNFRKLPAEVQAKVVELLAKLDKTEAQNVENLVRSPAFTALPEKEQLKMLEKLSTSPEAHESLRQSLETSPAALANPLGALDPASLLQMANLFEPLAAPAGEELATDVDRGGAALAPETRSPYAEIKRIVGGLRAAVPLSPAAVHGALGTRLAGIYSSAGPSEGPAPRAWGSGGEATCAPPRCRRRHRLRGPAHQGPLRCGRAPASGGRVAARARGAALDRRPLRRVSRRPHPGGGRARARCAGPGGRRDVLPSD